MECRRAATAIRAALIGSATRLPFLWVLIGILGGVEAFSLLGLFILWLDFLAGEGRG